jgi:predicted nucleic acid binding AN1-type Zn finger protein
MLSDYTQRHHSQIVYIKYNTKKQYAIQESTAQPLDKKGKNFIQKVCRKFLFLTRSTDSLLCPISAIASQSAKPKSETMQQTKQLLDYIASQKDTSLLTMPMT